VAVAVLLTLALSGGGKGSSGLAAPGPVRTGTVLTAHAMYTVRPGDTLWSIAERLDPQGDPRPLIAKLSRQVGGDSVRPGERLILP
jgi:nucleoid-associated protein YgaU